MKNINLTSTQEMSFENEKIYIGLDVHSTSWKVTIRFGGQHFKTFSNAASVGELMNYLNKNFPKGDYYSVYEAGFCGFSVHRELEKQGIKSIIVNPADIPLSDKDRKFKSDTRDSKTLAEQLEKENLRAIYIPTRQAEFFRSVFRLRESAKKDKQRIMNRIKMYLYTRGYRLGNNAWSKKSITALRKRVKGTMSEFITIKLLNELKGQKILIVKISKELKRLIKEQERKKEQQILETVPGIGPQTAITLLAEVITPDRFKSDGDFCSYIGLIPNTHSSGEKEKATGLTNRKNGKLRHAIIESAWIATRNDPELKLAYVRLCKRMRSTNAIIRIAKKLAIRIKHLWTKMEVYQKNVNMVKEA